MKRFCPHCGFDQFGRIVPGEAEAGRRTMTCDECGESFDHGRLQELSRKPGWWYWLVSPLLAAPAILTLIAPLIDRLAPDRHVDARLTFWALAASPVYFYVLSSWIFLVHRLARWYFGAVPAALVLTVLNLLLAGAIFVARA